VRRYTSLSGRREFALVLRRGRASSTKALTVSVIAGQDSSLKPKVGIIITAKVGNAVERNRLRRRCKAIIDEVNMPNGIRLVIACRPAARELEYEALRTQLICLLQESTTAAGNASPRRELSKR
jgi:ribonuclease P protein component